MLSMPLVGSYASSQKPLQPRAHASLSRSPGTLHESLLHSTYHRLPCFIVIYVRVCLPQEAMSFQRGGQGLCVLGLPSLVPDRMLDAYAFAELASQPLMSGGRRGGGEGIHVGS